MRPVGQNCPVGARLLSPNLSRHQAQTLVRVNSCPVALNCPVARLVGSTRLLGRLSAWLLHMLSPLASVDLSLRKCLESVLFIPWKSIVLDLLTEVLPYVAGLDGSSAACFCARTRP